MAKGAKQAHGAIADVAVLNGVLEYSSEFDPSKLPYDSIVNTFSQDDGSYETSRLAKMCTRYPLSLRSKQAENTVKHMTQRGKTDNSANTPHVLALWDAIGIAHELNGFRNDAAGWLKIYGEERELQFSALTSIEGTKKALEKHVGEQADQQIENINRMPDPLAARESRARAGLKSHPNDPYWQQEMSEVTTERKRRDEARAKNAKDYKDKQVARSWEKYEAKLDKASLTTFKKNWDKLLTQADPVIERRTQALVNWLEAKLLIDSLEDFHPSNIEDGVMFEGAIGDAIFGIGSSKSGQNKIDAWVKEGKASAKSNLLWRVVALNQEKSISDVDAALALAEEHKGKRTVATALNTEGIVAKILKVFADTHKKAAGVLNANTSAKSESGSFAYGARIKPIRIRNLDLIATTAGDRVLAHFKVDGLADHISEKIIQHMFSIRAMVDPKDSLALVVAQAAAEPASRSHLLRRMAAAETFLGESTAGIKTAQADNMRKAWENFRGTAKGPDAIRDARLAVLVMLIEGLNFQKLLVECKTKGDDKTYWSLAASSMTITSGLFDVASVPAKNVFGAESWSYQKIKLFGGVLSVAATGIGVGLDIEDAKKNLERDKYLLFWLYGGKSFLGVLNVGLTVATTFTYAAPLVGRLTGSPVYAGAARAVGARAAAIIGTRILLMSAGAWLTIGTFTVQVFIWRFSDDDLQSWCERSAFGLKRDKGWSPKRQMDEYTEALRSVGVSV